MTEDTEARLLEVLERLDARLEVLEAKSVTEAPSVPVAQAAAMLGVSVRHVWKQLADGALSGPIVGRRRFVSTESVLAVLRGGETAPAKKPARSRRGASIRAIPVPQEGES